MSVPKPTCSTWLHCEPLLAVAEGPLSVAAYRPAAGAWISTALTCDVPAAALVLVKRIELREEICTRDMSLAEPARLCSLVHLAEYSP